MKLVQILLPLSDNEGNRFPRAVFDEVRSELTDRFGGVTAFTRAPATGLWAESAGDVVRDDIVVYEVMAERPEPAWWAAFRTRLEQRLRQDEIVIRAMEIERL